MISLYGVYNCICNALQGNCIDTQTYMVHDIYLPDKGAPRKGGGGDARLQPPRTPQNWNLIITDFLDIISKSFTWFPLRLISAPEIGWWIVHENFEQ
jgi:hypothetical protein